MLGPISFFHHILNFLSVCTEHKDGIILMLLQVALKAKDAKLAYNRSDKPPKKKARTESEELKENRKNEREKLILYIEVSLTCCITWYEMIFVEFFLIFDILQKIEDFGAAVRTRQESHAKSDDPIHPFAVIVGPLSVPTKHYSIIGEAHYATKSAIEAVVLCLKIYLSCNIPYPKEAKSALILLQKCVLQVSTQSDKMNVGLSSALSFIEKSLGVTF